ncbi:MAG: alpha/beta hydrolase [Nocardioidaceae bacterium]|nr:alpha/beta hydrolase [Nocardioidaceae bacterium]
MSGYWTVRANDGTRLRAWDNGSDGVPVIISNGLGSPPAAWPAVTEKSSGFRVVTWYHRGLGGSQRPLDAGAIQVEHHVADLGSVMESAGIERALIIGWSMGVNVAFEFAQTQPERVAGILAVGGIPGGSLTSMFGSVGMPRHLREPVGRMSAQMLRISGPWLSLLGAAIPRSHHPLSRTGIEALAREAGHAGALAAVLREFLAHDWDWYSRLVLAAGDHRPIDVSSVGFPVTLLAGRHDSITSSDDIVAVAQTIPGARVSVLPAGTHFLPLQYPGLMLEELRRLTLREVSGETGGTQDDAAEPA